MSWWVSIVALGLVACSVDCEEARDKIERCTPANATFPMPIINEDCNEDDQCLAECVDDHSCETIRADLRGSVTDPNQSIPEDAGEFRACVFACVE